MSYSRPGVSDVSMTIYRFQTLIGSRNRGLRLKADIFEKDCKTFFRSHATNHPRTSGNRASNAPSNVDIIGVLRAAAQQKGSDLLDRYQAALEASQPRKDAALLRLYNDAAVDHVQAYKEDPQPELELRRIRDHVDAAWVLFREGLNTNKREQESATSSFTKNGTRGQKGARKDIMLAATRAYARPIEGIKFFKYCIDQIKASYAYQLAEEFSFTVAFQELCNMKARAHAGGNIATFSGA